MSDYQPNDYEQMFLRDTEEATIHAAVTDALVNAGMISLHGSNNNNDARNVIRGIVKRGVDLRARAFE